MGTRKNGKARFEGRKVSLALPPASRSTAASLITLPLPVTL